MGRTHRDDTEVLGGRFLPALVVLALLAVLASLLSVSAQARENARPAIARIG